MLLGRTVAHYLRRPTLGAMIDDSTPRGAKARGRLAEEPVIWLTTVTESGQPQTSPVWFLFAGGEFLVYSMADTALALCCSIASSEMAIPCVALTGMGRAYRWSHQARATMHATRPVSCSTKILNSLFRLDGATADHSSQSVVSMGQTM